MTEEKECPHHGLTTFVLDKYNKRTRCRKCQTERVTQYRVNNKKKLVNYLGGKCCLCGYNKHQGVLQFHHLDPSSKKFGISARGISRCYANSLEEVKKCVLLCANCHFEVEQGVSTLTEEHFTRLTNEKDPTI